MSWKVGDKFVITSKNLGGILGNEYEVSRLGHFTDETKRRQCLYFYLNPTGKTPADKRGCYVFTDEIRRS